MKTQAKRFHVSGRVQGVGFRFFAEHMATKLGIGGYVKNLYDGRVEIYALGSPERLTTLKEALRRGPAMARVDRLDESDAEILPEYANMFTVERDE